MCVKERENRRKVCALTSENLIFSDKVYIFLHGCLQKSLRERKDDMNMHNTPKY